MNPMNSIRRSALALLGALALGSAVPTVAMAQGVTVNGTQLCVDAPNMTITPSGTMTVTCTPVSTNPSNPPNCSIPQTSATTGVVTTISAVCNPAATSYAWAGSVAPTGGFTSVASFQVTFPTAGTYQYAVQGTNANGAGNTATATITVTDPGQPGNCASFPAAASTTTWATTGQQNTTVTFVAEGYATFKLPLFTSASSALGTIGLKAFSAVNYISPGKTSDGNTLRAQFAVSTCPGDFTSSAIPAKCTATGTPENQAIQLLFKSYATPTGYCTLVPGTQYYLNVKNLNCLAGTNCTEIVKMN